MAGLDRSSKGNTSACKTNQAGAIPPKPREAAMSKDHDQYGLTANIQNVIHVLDTPASTGGKDDEPDGEERETIHVYPVAGGGVLFTRTPIEEEPLDTQPYHRQ